MCGSTGSCEQPGSDVVLEVVGVGGGGHLLLIKLSIPMTTVRLAQVGGWGSSGTSLPVQQENNIY